MSDISIQISIPVDEDKFLRRECPHCIREFKVQILETELRLLSELLLHSYLGNSLDSNEDDIQTEENLSDYHCPYCQQIAPSSHWWTKEQLEYVGIFAKNVMSKLINEQLLKPMRQAFNKKTKHVSMSFKGSDIPEMEAWISSEPNDMAIYRLQCCDKNIKIDDNWNNNITCFYCGFEHNFR